MSSRAAVAVYDPALAREASQAELRSKAAPQKLEAPAALPRRPEAPRRVGKAAEVFRAVVRSHRPNPSARQANARKARTHPTRDGGVV